MDTRCTRCQSATLIATIAVHDDETGWGYSAREQYVMVASTPHAFLCTGQALRTL